MRSNWQDSNSKQGFARSLYPPRTATSTVFRFRKIIFWVRGQVAGAAAKAATKSLPLTSTTSISNLPLQWRKMQNAMQSCIGESSLWPDTCLMQICFSCVEAFGNTNAAPLAFRQLGDLCAPVLRQLTSAPCKRWTRQQRAAIWRHNARSDRHWTTPSVCASWPGMALATSWLLLWSGRCASEVSTDFAWIATQNESCSALSQNGSSKDGHYFMWLAQMATPAQPELFCNSEPLLTGSIQSLTTSTCLGTSTALAAIWRRSILPPSQTAARLSTCSWQRGAALKWSTACLRRDTLL